jgi:hypothetical protein
MTTLLCGLLSVPSLTTSPTTYGLAKSAVNVGFTVVGFVRLAVLPAGRETNVQL